MGYAYIYYLRQLQMEVLRLAKERTTNSGLRKAGIGMLNMYLCRSYIQRTRTTKSGVRMDGLKAADSVVRLIRAYQAARPFEHG